MWGQLYVLMQKNGWDMLFKKKKEDFRPTGTQQIISEPINMDV